MKGFKVFINLLKESFQEWNADHASRLAAALSYYTIFSLAPFVLIILTLLGWIYQDETFSVLLLDEVANVVGESGAAVFKSIIAAASQPAENAWAAVIGGVTAVVGATGIFVQLKDALNTAWGVTESRFKGVWGVLLVRVISIAAILVIYFLLLVSLILSTVLSVVTSRVNSSGAETAVLIQILNQVIMVGFITVIFALMYKFLPDTKIAWKDVWIGAFFTSLLFNIGKFLIGLYIGNSHIGSSFGAAGSVLVILVWVYYSAQIVLFGAEFTQVYSKRVGTKMKTGTLKILRKAQG